MNERIKEEIYLVRSEWAGEGRAPGRRKGGRKRRAAEEMRKQVKAGMNGMEQGE